MKSYCYCAIALLLVAGLTSGQAQGANRYWNVTSGNWSTAGNWSGGLPTASDTAYVGAVGGVLTGAATIDTAGAAAGFFYVGYGTGTNGTVQMTGGSLAVGSFTAVGYTGGQGTFTQSGGTHMIASGMAVGVGAGTGTYNLSGSGALNASYVDVGLSGQGTFNQSGGTVSLGTLFLSYNSGGSGTYNLSGNGSLSATTVQVGHGGSGNFLQSGGSVALTNSLQLGTASGGSGNYTMGGGTLTAGLLQIATAGDGEYKQTWGTATFSGAITAGSATNRTGTLTVGNGTLSAGGGITSFGAVWLTGGTIETPTMASNQTLTMSGGWLKADTVDSYGVASMTGGSIWGKASVSSGVLNNYGSMTITNTEVRDRIVNAGALELGGSAFYGEIENFGTVSFSAAVYSSNGIVNYNRMSMAVGRTLSSSDGLENYGTFDLAPGDLLADVTNRGGGTFRGYGKLDGFLTNGGLIQPTGLMVVTQPVSNTGEIALYAGCPLQTGGLSNLSGGLIHGSGLVTGGAVTNNGGIIRADGYATLTIDYFAGGNINGGEIQVYNGSTLSIGTSFSSSGAIVLSGDNAQLAGSSISNSGEIRGYGRISNPISNNGIVRAEGGTLTLSAAALSNTSGSQFQIAQGATLFLTQGLATNQGQIILTGGTLDTNLKPLAVSSTGRIVGDGQVRTGALNNLGLISMADGPSSFTGDVTNDAGANINVTECTTTFYGSLTSYGTIKNTGGVIRVLGASNIYGPYLSDPADNFFANINIGPDGYLVGGLGDRFFISGDFENVSSAGALWDTAAADLRFQGGSIHRFDVAGADNGPMAMSAAKNFAWGSVSLGAGQSLVLDDADRTPGGALYVGAFVLDGGIAQVASIMGNGMSVYYDPAVGANAYLGGNTYMLAGGGELSPLRKPGDCDINGQVNDDDLSLLLANWSATSAPWGKGNFNKSQYVDDDDLSLLLANWTGSGSSVPEPASLAILAMGVATMLRRRAGPVGAAR